MDTATATDLINDFKAAELEVTVRLTDGTEVYGTPVSVNSKGVNLKVDGKVRSFGLNRVNAIFNDADDEGDVVNVLTEVPEDIQAKLHDGMTTAELAELLDTTPKELRVTLRALGMGVGKGRKYSLTPSAYVAVRNAVAASA